MQENVERFQKTLEKVKRELGQTLPIVIDGKHITKDDTFDSINPANTSELIAKVSKATKDDVEKHSNLQIKLINHGASGHIEIVLNYYYV